MIWLLFCRAENMARKNAGEEPLPEEDPSNPIFKPIPEPSRLDSFLITNQTANYCNQINGYILKLFRIGSEFAVQFFRHFHLHATTIFIQSSISMDIKNMLWGI